MQNLNPALQSFHNGLTAASIATFDYLRLIITLCLSAERKVTLSSKGGLEVENVRNGGSNFRDFLANMESTFEPLGGARA